LDIDCNLILYAENRVLWSTKTSNKGLKCVLRLQEDGNLVLYSFNKNVLWHSNTYCNNNNCHENANLILQDDCNLVLYFT
ncbi:hypothetical protein SELMODRAFT_29034, partial [Selaginella moellendorffii]